MTRPPPERGARTTSVNRIDHRTAATAVRPRRRRPRNRRCGGGPISSHSRGFTNAAHAGAPTLGARARTNAGPGTRSGRVLLFASCEARGVVNPWVMVTAGPKHPLFLGGVYARLLATAPIDRPAFMRREVSRPRSAKTRDSPAASPTRRRSVRRRGGWPRRPAISRMRGTSHPTQRDRSRDPRFPRAGLRELRRPHPQCADLETVSVPMRARRRPTATKTPLPRGAGLGSARPACSSRPRSRTAATLQSSSAAIDRGWEAAP
jgi:hypothetical protein